jgi:hypothetical protein
VIGNSFTAQDAETRRKPFKDLMAARESGQWPNSLLIRFKKSAMLSLRRGAPGL